MSAARKRNLLGALVLAALVAGCETVPDPGLVGTLRWDGEVWLNGARVPQHTPVRTGSRVRAGPDSSARIDLEGGGWIQVGPGQGIGLHRRTHERAEQPPEGVRTGVILAQVEEDPEARSAIARLLAEARCTVVILVELIGPIFGVTGDGGASCAQDVRTASTQGLIRSRYNLLVTPEADRLLLITGQGYLREPATARIPPGWEMEVTDRWVQGYRLDEREIRQRIAWTQRYRFPEPRRELEYPFPLPAPRPAPDVRQPPDEPGPVRPTFPGREPYREPGPIIWEDQPPPPPIIH